MNRHVEMILRNTNIPQYWRTHSPRHKWLDLLGITTSNWTSPPAPLFHLFFASLPNSLYEAYDCEWIRLIIFLGSGFHWWWIFLVGGRLCIWICQICIFCIPNLSSEWIGLQFAIDQTLTKMNSRKTKHFYLPTFALGSTDWEHTKRPPPPSHPVGSLHPRQPPIIKTFLPNSIWTLCLKIFAHFIETLSIFALFFQTFVPKYRDVISFVIDSFEITAQ